MMIKTRIYYMLDTILSNLQALFIQYPPIGEIGNALTISIIQM